MGCITPYRDQRGTAAESSIQSGRRRNRSVDAQRYTWNFIIYCIHRSDSKPLLAIHAIARPPFHLLSANGKLVSTTFVSIQVCFNSPRVPATLLILYSSPSKSHMTPCCHTAPLETYVVCWRERQRRSGIATTDGRRHRRRRLVHGVVQSNQNSRNRLILSIF